MRLITLVCLSAVAALSTATLGWAATPAIAGGDYTGATSQREAGTIKISATGSKIKVLRLAVAYDGACGTGGGGPAFAVVARHVPIAANGSFTVTTVGKAPGVRSLKVIVTGSFASKHVTGTVAEKNGACAAPKQADNPYSATFTLVAH